MSKPIAEAKFYAMTAEAAVKTLQSDAGRGLSGSEAKKRLGVYGENRLQKGKKTSFAKKFMLQFGDFMVLILLIASAVSFAVSCMQGEANLADPLLILGIVIANAFVGTVQEAKAERALEALRTLSAPHADVLRDGKRAVISAEALVPGDVVYIRAGDVVPADLRLLESMHLQAEESALTGESVPSGKSANAVCDEMCSAAERKNMLFSGTGISAGRGHCDRNGHANRNGSHCGDARRRRNTRHAVKAAAAAHGQAHRAFGAWNMCGDFFDRAYPKGRTA